MELLWRLVPCGFCPQPQVIRCGGPGGDGIEFPSLGLCVDVLGAVLTSAHFIQSTSSDDFESKHATWGLC